MQSRHLVWLPPFCVIGIPKTCWDPPHLPEFPSTLQVYGLERDTIVYLRAGKLHRPLSAGCDFSIQLGDVKADVLVFYEALIDHIYCEIQKK